MPSGSPALACATARCTRALSDAPLPGFSCFTWLAGVAVAVLFIDVRFHNWKSKRPKDSTEKKPRSLGRTRITALGATDLLSIPNIRPKSGLRLKLMNIGDR